MVATYDRVSCRAVSYGACAGSTRVGIGVFDGDRQRPQSSQQRPRRRRTSLVGLQRLLLRVAALKAVQMLLLLLAIAPRPLADRRRSLLPS